MIKCTYSIYFLDTSMKIKVRMLKFEILCENSIHCLIATMMGKNLTYLKYSLKALLSFISVETIF